MMELELSRLSRRCPSRAEGHCMPLDPVFRSLYSTRVYRCGQPMHLMQTSNLPTLPRKKLRP